MATPATVLEKPRHRPAVVVRVSSLCLGPMEPGEHGSLRLLILPYTPDHLLHVFGLASHTLAAKLRAHRTMTCASLARAKRGEWLSIPWVWKMEN